MILDSLGRPIQQSAPRAPVAAAAPPLVEEAGILNGRDITRPYIWGLLQSQDAILRDKGQGNLELYEQLLQDGQVQSCFQQRRRAVISKDWQVVPGGTRAIDKSAAQWWEETIEKCNWDGTTDKMLFGLMYGYSVSELFWRTEGSKKFVELDKIHVRKARRFGFDEHKNLRLKTVGDQLWGEELDQRRFWVMSCGADNDDEPYGLGLGYYLYWPIFFARNGLRFWLALLESAGMKKPIGKYPRGSGTLEKSSLLAAIQALQTSPGVTIPEGMSIEPWETGSSTGLDQNAFQKHCEALISKIILSQTMTSDSGSSEAQARVHESVAEDITESDADLLDSSFSDGPMAWATEWNFPGAKPPRICREIEGDPDLVNQVETDKVIFDMGFEPDEAYINETYGGKWTKRKPTQPPVEKPPITPPAAPPTPSPPTPQFGAMDTPPATDYPQLFAEQMGTRSIEIFGRLMEPIQRLLASAPDLAAVADGVYGLYPELAPARSDLARLLGDGLLAAILAGAYEVDQEDAPDVEFAAAEEGGRLPFQEAIRYFQNKLNLPSLTYDQFDREQHDWAFMVAGVTSADLLVNLRAAVERSLTEGISLQAFTRQFDQITADAGWAFTGSVGWRAKVIYETNFRQAYSAGRTQQMDTPEMMARRPYRLYRHGDSRKPRPLHLSWDGLVLPANDPWWDTHTPMNGYGCKCRVYALNARDLARQGKTNPDVAPDNGSFPFTDRLTGVVRQVPAGIDAGFDYKPGASQGREQIIKAAVARLPVELRSQVQLPTVPKAATPPTPTSPTPSRPAQSVGSALKISAKDTKLLDAVTAIDAVHTDGVLPDLSVKSMAKLAAEGMFSFKTNGTAVDIKIKKSAQWPRTTLVHEVGHFIDFSALGEPGKLASVAHPALQGFRDAVQSTQAIQELEKILATPDLSRGYKKYCKYLLDIREVWARAYAQWVSIRSKNPAMQAEMVERLAANNWHSQWQEEDFAPVAAAIDKLMEEKGWLIK